MFCFNLGRNKNKQKLKQEVAVEKKVLAVGRQETNEKKKEDSSGTAGCICLMNVPNYNDQEILYEVLAYSGMRDLGKVSRVNSTWKSTANHLMCIRECFELVGHTGRHHSLMGKYVRSGSHNGHPKYKFAHKRGGKEVFMYRAPGYWMIGSADDLHRNIGWISVAIQPELKDCKYPPFHINRFEHWEGDWKIDDTMKVKRLPVKDSEKQDSVCTAFLLYGHKGQHKSLMGEYHLDGEVYGYPKYKFKGTHKGKSVFLFRTNEEYWLIGSSDDIPRRLGWISSSYCSTTSNVNAAAHGNSNKSRYTPADVTTWICLRGGWIEDKELKAIECRVDPQLEVRTSFSSSKVESQKGIHTVQASRHINRSNVP